MVTPGELANSLDFSDMLGHIRNFPSDLSKVWTESESWDLSAIENATFSGVICLGMGGSASGGDFLSCLSDADGCLPFIAHRGYDLPAWASENWLVISKTGVFGKVKNITNLEKLLEITLRESFRKNKRNKNK